MFDIILAMRVNVLVLDDVFDLGLSAVLDAFQTANELIGMLGLTVPRFEVKIVGVRKAVKTSQGLTVPVHATGWRMPDCVVVPANRLQDAWSVGECACEARYAGCGRCASTMGSSRRNHDRSLHRNLCDGRIRTARSSSRNHNMVAGAAFSEEISPGPAG